MARSIIIQLRLAALYMMHYGLFQQALFINTARLKAYMCLFFESLACRIKTGL